MIDVELFAGAGGMAQGLRLAGFGPAHLHELDPYACETLRGSRRGPSGEDDWTVYEGDLRSLDWSTVDGPVRLLAGGAPCQPFSLAGKHLAHDDGRNLFPLVFDAMRALHPAAVMLENVRGLLRESFTPYWEYILAQVAYPSITPRPNELWEDHYRRIRQRRRSVEAEPEYHVSVKVVDAADYGVPQNRYRVFMVAMRADLPPFRFPKPTHSRHALVRAQALCAYWDERGLPRRRPLLTNGSLPLDVDDGSKPWVTVRDALRGVPEPSDSEEGAEMNHWTIPGARAYHGHLGSPLDWPSKAIKAGVHGTPGGENTVLDHKGRIRYYTLREAARIQTFPDSHVFQGRRKHVYRQIGNAVPVALAAAIARPLRALLAAHLREDDVEAACGPVGRVLTTPPSTPRGPRANSNGHSRNGQQGDGAASARLVTANRVTLSARSATDT
jgi:DNA (cytosine-5)-methyltransferase 1